MVGYKIKISDRILAVLLSFILLMGIIPTTVLASEEFFTINVTKAGGDGVAIEGAEVSYQIKVNDVLVYSSSGFTGSDGNLSIPEMGSYVDEISAGNVKIFYKVEKEGYSIKTEEISVTNSKGVSITLSETITEPEFVNITVSKQGTGTGNVKINGQNVETTISVDKGSKISIEITPGENSYIANLSVGESTYTVDKFESYTKNDLTVNSNTDIQVEFKKEFRVTGNVGEHGKMVIISKTDGTSYEINSATESNFLIVEPDKNSIVINVTPDTGYQIASIKMDGENQKVDDRNHFVTSMDVTKNVYIEVVFVKVYQVQVNYDRKLGLVETVPDCVGGNIIVEENSNFHIKAIPNEGYRVSEVKINGMVHKTSEENNYIYEEEFTIDKNYTFDITFVSNVYNIEVANYNNGSVTLDKTILNHGENVKAEISADYGYRIETIKIIDKATNKEEELPEIEFLEDNGVTFTIGNVKGDKLIEVVFSPVRTADINDVSLTTDGLIIAKEDKKEYIYKKDAVVKLSTSKLGVAVYGVDGNLIGGGKDVKEITFSENTTIAKIELFYNDNNSISYYQPYWHSVEEVTVDNPYKIIIDKSINKPEILNTDESIPNDNGYYNGDVKFNVVASDDISGLESVTYYVYNNGEQTQTDSLYKYNEEEGIKYSFNDTITVDKSKNNSDNITVKVVSYDRAGNSNFEEKNIKINATKPTVSISINGTTDDNAQEGYYRSSREATITIIDRETTFDQDAANSNIVISAKNSQGQDIEISKSSMVSWTNNGDTHIATINFAENANYEWSFKGYTNKAGLSNDTVTETGNAIYSFTIDGASPNASISLISVTEPSTEENTNIWNTIVSTLTFGIWKNHSVEAVATATDDISPIYDIEYYKSNADTALTENQLVDLYEAGKFTTDIYKIESDEVFVVYARISDYAGNVVFVGTDGTIIDCVESEITIIPEEATNGIYGKEFEENGVNVDIHVKDYKEDDEVDDSIYSGIKAIEYWVVCNGAETQRKTLYSFDYKRDNTENSNGGNLTITDWSNGTEEVTTKYGTVPTRDMLISEWNGSVVIDPRLNNSDNVVVYVRVTDNAGNTETDDVNIKINTDDPAVSIEFDDEANRTDGDRGYFENSRTATITITDRPSSFDEAAATAGISIEAYNAKGEAITLSDSEDVKISNWSYDNKNHYTATVQFNKDANYKWSFNYTNKANNTLDTSKIETGTSQTPFIFTVDNTDPTGSLKIGTNVWDKLLSVITFGLYKTSKPEIISDADDEISPIDIRYYKTDNPKAMTTEELNEKVFNSEVPTLSKNEQFVIYMKVIDYAGNYVYISSDGNIIDNVKSTINITEPEKTANGIYGKKFADKGVKIKIKVDDFDTKDSVDDNIYSGIKNIEYWVECDGKETQRGTLYNFDYKRNEGKNSNGGVLTITDYSSGKEEKKTLTGTKPAKEDLCKSWEGNVIIDANKNNSSNVMVYVKAIDNAGNTSNNKLKLDIDTIQPAISVSYNNNKDNSGNTYFNAKRTATIVITERTGHFNAVDATKGIVITAVDGKGNKVNAAYKISDWVTKENSTPDKATHTATIQYQKDANYTFRISYTDKAGNVNTAVNTGKSAAPYKFTIDTVAPSGTIKAVSAEGRAEEWNTLNNNLTFGFWSKQKITVTGTSSDITSPVVSVEYYKASSKVSGDSTEQYNTKKLDSIKSWTSFNGLELTPNEQCVVYIKITDKAGNRTYVSTNGLIIDDKAPLQETIAPEITISPEQPINGIYNGDVKVNIKVQEPVVGGTYSGLKNISYKVYNRAVSTSEPTQSGTLYQFNISNPKKNDLLKSWSGQIVIDSTKNNSNDIIIEVYADDNCQNSSSSSTSIKIDTTSPTIDISYSNNTASNDYFFKSNRTATIVITERNFNPDDVKVKITNTDGSIPQLSAWVESKSGTGNQDDKQWTSTITYSADGDYTFDISYNDLAGNKCVRKNYASNTVAGEAFTIDKTVPQIKVSYDNNNAKNTNYYNSSRVATIVITEHNFDKSKVDIKLTATNDGNNVSVPNVSGWSTNGDNHTATISYNSDALYTFDISVTDKATNKSADFANQSFYIDKTAPTITITGVKQNSANKGDLAPVITYADTNYDANNVSIELIGVNRKSVQLDGTYTDVHNGRKFTFNNFAKKEEIDDIYALKVTLTDKAGNTSTKTVNFSVNRFGSTYSLGESANKQNGSFVKNSEDIIITETNANKLSNIKITLFKNNDTIVLKENVDYAVNVEGGNGEWYRYTYTVYKKNFKDDGIYRLSVHSEDAAGNVAENTLDTKDKEISFGIDTTSPTIVVRNLESNKTYALDNMTVIMSVNDNLKLDVIKVELDGKEYKSWNSEEIEKLISENGEFKFDIPGDFTTPHNVKILCRDAAGNETVEEITNFYVTTNLMIRYFNNKPLFYGSIAGVIILAGVIVFLIVWKRRKNA